MRRLAAMVFGKTDEEQIQLNEETYCRKITIVRDYQLRSSRSNTSFSVATLG